MKKLISAILVVTCAMGGILLTSCSDSSSKKRDKKDKEDEKEVVKVNLNDYLDYSVEGEYSGDIYIDYTFNVSDVWNDSKDLKEVPFEDVSPLITGSWDVTEKLSNGDVATWTWTVDEKALVDLYDDEDIELKLSYTDVTVEIKGYNEREIFNPFDYVEVHFEGPSPYAHISVSTDSSLGCLSNNIEYDSYRNFSEGEVLTLSIANISTVEAYCEANNFTLGETTREYVVENVDRYIDSADEITQDMIDMMAAQGINIFYGKTEWDDNEVVDAITYDGIYLLTQRYTNDLWSYYAYNQCYIVYKVDITNDKDGSNTYYYYVMFENLYVKNDGTFIVDMSQYDATYGSGYWGYDSGNVVRFGDSGYWYAGYSSVDDFYKSEIMTNLTDYDFTTTYTE